MPTDADLGTPPRSGTPTSRPSLSRSTSSLSGIASLGVERVGENWSEGLVLLDVIETFFDSRLDLWERRLKKSSRQIKRRAAELVPKGLRTPKGSMVVLDDSGDDTSGSAPNILTKRAVRHKQDVERELSRLKVNIADRVNRLSASWASDSVVRTREKFSFVLGVCTLAGTCLLWGLAPTWFPATYTVQALIYLTWRIYSYKKKHFHYFLFDLCYFVNVLDMVWLWFFPSSTVLFICSYCLTMGPLASAIITWRNSLVFHSIDKVTSLFIHIYPPLVFGIILFRYPNAGERYPGIVNVNDYGWVQRIALSAVPYCLWQLSYWKFISVDRHDKIASGQRENSFHYLLHDKHNPIGRALRGIKETHRETWFMFGQLIYSIIFMIPASTLFLHNATATYICLAVLFVVSTWNGASFYVEVFGRKFARELEKLRKEMDAMSATSSNSSGRSPSNPSTPAADENMPVKDRLDALANSPLILPAPNTPDVSELPPLDRVKAE
ncbi:putative integral to membrane protein [Cutaneotrichosporon oleaginosum]|uniref:Glycerophosphocholine acyltransferase 1 n=1 Tax=Cutaneotrichosporon oleaginosum TaxID=879819 RepID=A0A0J1BB24_9TREE|nr:putative integral to membrane protein [Cutaneotrichosporon oleaginosum]KLT45149.1 putative integral to membrane protein [Cutaneotrichosporon oleaginosum]TXT09829.1 hypothetical protein COLE_03763 [Cutaneotrichosporon oleaginosum]